VTSPDIQLAPHQRLTVVESSPDPKSKTIVTKLPADPAGEEPDAGETTQTPKRRRGLWRRKQPAEAGAADPWEA